MSLRNSLSRSLVLTANRLKDRIDSYRNPAFVIAAAKMGLDLVFGDVERGYIGQRTFQAVSHLDKHLSILNEHEEDNAIATLLLTDAPRLGDPLSVICDV